MISCVLGPADCPLKANIKEEGLGMLGINVQNH